VLTRTRNPRKGGTGFSPSIASNMTFQVRQVIAGKKNSGLLTRFGLAWALVSTLTLASGQQPASNAGSATESQKVYRSDAVISVDSDLVLIPVTVTDHSGKSVSGLEKEHFRLFEDSTEQQITHFIAEDVPASVGIVFDTSGSMQSKFGKAFEAVNTLLNNANPDDEFFFVRFSSEARLAVPFTSSLDNIRFQMGRLHATGTTAVLDAVRLALDEMRHARHTRKALVIISDGEDNASHWTVDQLRTAVKERDILIYAIGIGSLPGERSECLPGSRCGFSLLSEIASQSGGRLFEVKKLQQLPEIAATIGGWLRHQYVLGYVPSRAEKDGTFRRIQLKVARPKGYPRLNAVWRQGYYAPKE
jgi:VWFA-related protein